MKEYRFTEETAKKTMNSGLRFFAPFLIGGSIVGICIANFTTKGSIFGSLLVFLIIILVLVIATMIGINRSKKSLMKAVYRLSDTGIEVITSDTESVSIDFDKIKSHKIIKRGLYINGQKSQIFIPVDLDGYDEITNTILEKINKI
ncbi:MAG: hypothetical protein M0Q45_04490 [Bacteroidales bacterium]|jgi:flagellar biosynthesis protein FliQ|nr:hypothetical protein [Bacteroidales bacterium]MCK9498747.1 hypothetical protein [Bacteroidales bacterium]MDY0314379.1 hypothetical protein [Bacteroidales bacterium]